MTDTITISKRTFSILVIISTCLIIGILIGLWISANIISKIDTNPIYVQTLPLTKLNHGYDGIFFTNNAHEVYLFKRESSANHMTWNSEGMTNNGMLTVGTTTIKSDTCLKILKITYGVESTDDCFKEMTLAYPNYVTDLFVQDKFGILFEDYSNFEKTSPCYAWGDDCN